MIRLAQPQKLGTEQGAAGEIEGESGFFRCQLQSLGLPLSFGQLCEVYDL